VPGQGDSLAERRPVEHAAALDLDRLAALFLQQLERVRRT
jgi:hypothetical protein